MRRPVYWRKSAPICPSSRRPHIWHPGLESVQGTMKVLPKYGLHISRLAVDFPNDEYIPGISLIARQGIRNACGEQRTLESNATSSGVRIRSLNATIRDSVRVCFTIDGV